jgi:hypothetical protein
MRYYFPLFESSYFSYCIYFLFYRIVHCVGVVEAFLTLMWASRRGLTEEEIAILMSGMGYQRNDWSPIFLVMEDMLFRSGNFPSMNRFIH